MLGIQSLLCVVLVCTIGLLVALYPNTASINKVNHVPTSDEALVHEFNENYAATAAFNSLVKEKTEQQATDPTEHPANYSQPSNRQQAPETGEETPIDHNAMNIDTFLQQQRYKAMVTKEFVDVPLEEVIASLKDVPEFMLQEVPGLKDHPPTNKDYSATNFPISPVYMQFPTVPRIWYDRFGFLQGNFKDSRALLLTKKLSKWVASACPHLDILHVKCNMTACEIDLSPIKGLDLTGKGWWSPCYIPNYLRSIGYETQLRHALLPRHYRQEIYSFYSEYY
ncbi:hypothetical protein [Catenovulum sediminis]|uniref:hypothetical protein n=1 Tax=Catenovulum sediminis TaxID=1740262 RepID=UPI00117C9143|nr:hypothetical protein [Catenovulum sediminis]